MPKGQGYSYGNGLMSGTTKSNSKSAPGEDKGGNLGKPIGDTGKKCPKGNSRTRGAADRYK
jgi:hypothetical protein